MIPISIPYLYDEDKQLAIKAIQDGFIANGKQINEFEEKFAEYCNRKHGVTCSNGTVALYLAIKVLNLPRGSEVILPSMTILSCLTAIVENNLTPVFCDIDPITWNIDIKSVRSKITSNTSALIVVDTYGLTINVDTINELKQDFPNIKIIEDASEAHGSNYKGIKAGSIGDISTFSFYANKIITTGEGGMILTDNDEIYQRLLMLKNLNFTDRKKYIHSEVGWNFRLTNLQCCLGLGQLQNIDKTIKQRRRIAERYNNNLKHIHIQLPFEDKDNYNVYWYYSILIKSNYDKILKALDNNGIDYRHFFYPLHLQPFIKDTNISLPVCQRIVNQGLILPTFTELTNDQIDFISNVILEQL